MVRPFKVYMLYYALGIISILLILIGIKHRSKTNYHKGTAFIENQEIIKLVQPIKLPVNSYRFNDIEKIIEKARSRINFDLSKYNFSHSGVSRLEDLRIDLGGQPIRTLVISSWSSGSTFIGDLLQSVPGTYYHSEPLRKDGMIQVRTPEHINQALANLRNMFKCHFEEMEDYLEFLRSTESVLYRNHRLWNDCKHKKDMCFNADFHAEYCKMSPFQAMKTCRVRLRYVQEILDDEELNVNIILLLRDPRGVFNSRRRRGFCQLGLDCSLPDIYCADLIRDYMTASRLIPLYPGRVMALRFEDLALNTYATTQHIFQFLKLDFTKSTDKFLQLHTNNDEAFKSTFRVSSTVPFKWRYLMDYKDVNEIQLICKEAMRLWGYKMVHNAIQMKSPEFYPLENYTVTGKTNK